MLSLLQLKMMTAKQKTMRIKVLLFIIYLQILW
jgi:hypothetical protein